MIVDLLLHGRSDLVNKLADLKRRSHFETDVVQQSKKLTVPPLALVHASVLDRDGDLAGQQIQQLHLIFAEITRLRAFNIEHSDDAVLADQWNRKFGTRVLDRFDVSRVLPHITDNNGCALHRCGAGDAVAELDTQVLHELRRVSNRKPKIEILLLIIDQKDREDLVWNDSIRQLGDLLQQLIKIENGSDLVVDLYQRGDESAGFGTHCCGCGIRLHFTGLPLR